MKYHIPNGARTLCGLTILRGPLASDSPTSLMHQYDSPRELRTVVFGKHVTYKTATCARCKAAAV